MLPYKAFLMNNVPSEWQYRSELEFEMDPPNDPFRYSTELRKDSINHNAIF